MIDTRPELGVCGQCGAYVFGCHVGGLRTCVDTTLLDVDGYRAALLAGRRTFLAFLGADGAIRRLDFDRATAAPSHARLAAHGCNTVPRPLEAPGGPQEPATGACAAWQAQGWVPPASCPRRGAEPGTGPQTCQHCEPPPF